MTSIIKYMVVLEAINDGIFVGELHCTPLRIGVLC